MSDEMERLRGKAHKVAGVAIAEVPFPPENDEEALAHMQLIERVKASTTPLDAEVKASKQFTKALEWDLGTYFRERRRGDKSGERQQSIPMDGTRGPRRGGS